MQGGSSSNDLRVNWLDQCHILFCRGLKERRREYLNCIQVTQIIATATIIGLLWWDSDASSPKKLQDQVGVCTKFSVFDKQRSVWSF